MNEKDKKWTEFNKSLLEAAKKNFWGIYTNIRREMVEFLREIGEKEKSLETYLEVLYLDLNGPLNVGKGIKDFPMFDPDTGSVAPAITYEIKELAKEIGISTNEIKEIFIRHNHQVYKALKLPLTPEEAWKKQEKDTKYGIK